VVRRPDDPPDDLDLTLAEDLERAGGVDRG
jgi:hypothetical protein